METVNGIGKEAIQVVAGGNPAAGKEAEDSSADAVA
jgi:hypothetical protein